MIERKDREEIQRVLPMFFFLSSCADLVLPSLNDREKREREEIQRVLPERKERENIRRVLERKRTV